MIGAPAEKDTWVATAFLAASEAAGALLTMEALHERWSSPSALAGFTVGELAGHFVRAVGVTNGVLSRGHVSDKPVELIDYYTAATATWRDRSETIHANASAEASAGARHLVERWSAALDECRQLLTQDPPRAVRTGGGAVLALDDYLLTRAVELLVHADDLAASLDVACPQAPDRLVGAVNDLLIGLARKRHGETAVLRALTRRERDTADALRVI